jgi:hypothetical protein
MPTPEARIERCVRCDDPTGSAGRGEDSRYVEDEGPLCRECCAEREDYHDSLRRLLTPIPVECPAAGSRPFVCYGCDQCYYLGDF